MPDLCSHTTSIRKVHLAPDVLYSCHGPPFWLKRNHLKSNFDQHKSSIFVPPQAGCCFPDGDAFLYVDSSPCLAAAACTRWCEGLCCLCTTCAKNLRRHWGSCGRWSMSMWWTIKSSPVALFFSLSFFLFSSFLSAGTRHLLGKVGLEPAGRGSSWKLLGWLSLWRALSKFSTDNEQSAVSCFQKAKRSGWDSRALQYRFPHNPSFMEG